MKNKQARTKWRKAGVIPHGTKPHPDDDTGLYPSRLTQVIPTRVPVGRVRGDVKETVIGKSRSTHLNYMLLLYQLASCDANKCWELYKIIWF